MRQKLNYKKIGYSINKLFVDELDYATINKYLVIPRNIDNVGEFADKVIHEHKGTIPVDELIQKM